MLEPLIKARLESALKRSQESGFVEKTFKELTYRFQSSPTSCIQRIKPIIRQYFHDEFVRHLTGEIEKDSDIEMREFIDAFVDDFATRFSLGNKQLHHFGLKGIANRYFPSPKFHSKQARKDRNTRLSNYFSRSSIDLDSAYLKGKERIKHDKNHGRFNSGGDAENAFHELLKEYFSAHFDVYKRKCINIGDTTTVQFDIILTRKDRFSAIEPKPDPTTINIGDVVAAFEVKRTLTKDHVKHNSPDAGEIFDDRCLTLKRSVMPEFRRDESDLTPYQLLRGKIYFGVLCLDINHDAFEILSSGQSHADLYSLESHGAVEPRDPVDSADIIYCLNESLWIKETKLMGARSQHTIHSVQKGKNSMDKSTSSLGCLIASMRRFFVAQGHIAKDEQNEYLKGYENFDFLPSLDSLKLQRFQNVRLTPDLENLIGYLNTNVPNQYSSVLVEHRAPLRVLKKWSTSAAQDISGYVECKLKNIVKLEMERNYHPLRFGPNSFDECFRSLFNQ